MPGCLLKGLESAREPLEPRCGYLSFEPPEVTIGRGDGPPYRHIKLSARTVSRQHARLKFENGRWTISNLSMTNPTVVNGEELSEGTDCRLLHDGDTIEMGEIVLRFRMG